MIIIMQKMALSYSLWLLAFKETYGLYFSLSFFVIWKSLSLGISIQVLEIVPGFLLFD